MMPGLTAKLPPAFFCVAPLPAGAEHDRPDAAAPSGQGAGAAGGAVKTRWLVGKTRSHLKKTRSDLVFTKSDLVFGRVGRRCAAGRYEAAAYRRGRPRRRLLPAPFRLLRPSGQAADEFAENGGHKGLCRLGGLLHLGVAHLLGGVAAA